VTGTAVTSAAGPSLGTTVTATATCPSGVALGGGGETSVSNVAERDNFVIVSTFPSSATVWTVTAVVTANFGGGRTGTVTPYVLCSQ